LSIDAHSDSAIFTVVLAINDKHTISVKHLPTGKSVIMVIVDRLIKYAHFFALSHPFKSSTVATTFMETVQKLHASPNIIVSDRDPIFTGHFWTELFSCLGTQLAHSSSYHPQYDGQTEIVNTCLEGYLRCFVSDKQTQWFKWLPLARMVV
jgi:hypothetical protein